MKKLFSAIIAMSMAISLSATASADLQTDLKIFHQDDGSSIVGILDDNSRRGWCAVDLAGDSEGSVFWGFFQDGNASGFLCMKDGTSIPVTYENGKITANQGVSKESNAASKKEDSSVTIGIKTP